MDPSLVSSTTRTAPLHGHVQTTRTRLSFGLHKYECSLHWVMVALGGVAYSPETSKSIWVGSGSLHRDYQ